MSHHCRCFREGVSEKRTALGVDPGVSDKVRDEESLPGHIS